MHLGLILLMLGVGAGFAVHAWRRDQQRQEAVRTWALGRDWHVWPGGDFGPHIDHPGVKIFQKGHARRSDTLVRGEIGGRPVALFDYRFTTGSGKSQATHRHGVAIMRTDFPVIPLAIRREHALDQVTEFLGADDIDFESAEFSRSFYVTSPDRKWAYDIIHARTMDFLLAEARDFSIEFGTLEIVVHRRGYCDPDRYEQALILLEGLHDLVPDYVVRQMKGETT